MRHCCQVLFTSCVVTNSFSSNLLIWRWPLSWKGIIHLNTDELLDPAGALEYSLRQLLSDVPNNDAMLVFCNYQDQIGDEINVVANLGGCQTTLPAGTLDKMSSSKV